MKILIAEDDYASSKYLYKLLSMYGECDMAEDGIEAVEKIAQAYRNGKPYDLLCLDIMMPKIDGLKALNVVREYEKKKGIIKAAMCKVMVTSALSDVEFFPFVSGLEVYLSKPASIDSIRGALRELGFSDLQ